MKRKISFVIILLLTSSLISGCSFKIGNKQINIGKNDSVNDTEYTFDIPTVNTELFEEHSPSVIESKSSEDTYVPGVKTDVDGLISSLDGKLDGWANIQSAAESSEDTEEEDSESPTQSIETQSSEQQSTEEVVGSTEEYTSTYLEKLRNAASTFSVELSTDGIDSSSMPSTVLQQGASYLIDNRNTTIKASSNTAIQYLMVRDGWDAAIRVTSVNVAGNVSMTSLKSLSLMHFTEASKNTCVLSDDKKQVMCNTICSKDGLEYSVSYSVYVSAEVPLSEINRISISSDIVDIRFNDEAKRVMQYFVDQLKLLDGDFNNNAYAFIIKCSDDSYNVYGKADDSVYGMVKVGDCYYIGSVN